MTHRDSHSQSAARAVKNQGRFGLALVIIGLVGAVSCAALWWLSAIPRLPQARSIPQTDVAPLGANFFLDREVEHWKQEKTLEMARAAGICWIKQQFSWEEIEPERKGEYLWEKYDRIVELAERYDMRIIARLDCPPDWSRGGDSSPKTRPPDDLGDFGDLVQAFVEHYKGRVQHIQIWNEPNLSAEWGFQRVDAVAYTRLLQVAYARAKEADPNVLVLSAPLAITLEDASMRGNHNDLAFLREMYEAGAGAYFDILSANAFGLDAAPEEPPAAHLLNFRRVELQRAIMEEFGDGAKPIWINEYGWNAAPASLDRALLTWERVPPDQQADYTLRGLRWAQENWPWLGVTNIWYFRQVGDIPPDRAAYYFALVDPEFNPSPAYEALQQAYGGPSLAAPGLHEETSPAVSAPGWQLRLDADASGGSLLTPGQDAAALTFAFEGQRVALVTRLGPEQGQLRVSIDGKPPGGLPDSSGKEAVLSLQAAHAQRPVVRLLATGLGEGAHRLSLEPVGPEPVAVDAFLVSADQGWGPVLAGGMLVSLLALVAGRFLRRGGKGL